jgi:ubiquitin C-terminal hydrolase
MQALLCLPRVKQILSVICADYKSKIIDSSLLLFFVNYFIAQEENSDNKISLINADQTKELYSTIFQNPSNYNDFSVNKQCDAREFMQWILTLSENDILLKEFQKFLPLEESTITCSACDKAWETNSQPVFPITVPFLQPLPLNWNKPLTVPLAIIKRLFGFGPKNSIQNNTNEYLKTEKTDEDFSCMFCAQKQTCTKQIKIVNEPDLLPVQFKRFEYNQQTNRINKITTPATIPLQYTTTINGAEVTYKLRSVIFHHGDTVENGHYTSVVRYNNVGWYECNDSTITVLDNNQLTRMITDSKTAYIIFYEKTNNL